MIEACIKNPILLVGNPNTGKTTLFNKITSSNEHVGNWHGVTVEEKAKRFYFNGKEMVLVDLPGIYSLKSLSYEEQVAIDYIFSHKQCKIINICDVNNLERNLFLTLCLLEKGIDVVLAINSTLKKPNCKVNTEKLSKMLDIDVVSINAQNGQGISLLLEKALIKRTRKRRKEISNMYKDAEEKYKEISIIMNCCTEKTKEVYGKSKADKFFLNRFFAPVIFLSIIAIIFYLTFFLIGKPLSNFLSYCLEHTLGDWLTRLFVSVFGSQHWMTCLVSDAIIGGFCTILSFLPQIVLLFFFLAVIEDSGYLSRVAFMFDDILSKVGLSGKSIYTLLMGFGCSASAIMTARNMDDKKAKLKTVLVTPFLSCSARLPIYLAIGGAFFGNKNIFVIMLLYLLGVVVSIFSSWLLNLTILKSKDQSFLLEFPPYRMINLKKAGKVLWENTKSFILRIGSILISMNVIVWILSNFSFAFKFVQNEGGVSMLESIAKFISPIFAPLGFASWGIIVALLVGIIAKEGVLSTMALFGGGDLVLSLTQQNSPIAFSSISAVLAFLTFCLLYTPCLSTIAVMSKEVGKRWTVFSVFTQLLIAYLFAMIIFNFSKICLLVGVSKILLVSIVILIIFFSIVKLFSISKKSKCRSCKGCNK